MQIEIDGKIYDIEIIKKNNRNTYVRVKNGKIVVTTNYLTSKNSIIKLIMDNKKSIIQMINKDAKKIDKNDPIATTYNGVPIGKVNAKIIAVTQGNPFLSCFRTLTLLNNAQSASVNTPTATDTA
jgi:predicted metal-dependent hydrolase